MKYSDFTLVNVVINRPLHQKFAYKIDGIIGPECGGSRVEVNFSGSNSIGIITDINPEIKHPLSKLKKAKLLDKVSFISKDISNIELLVVEVNDLLVAKDMS